MAENNNTYTLAELEAMPCMGEQIVSNTGTYHVSPELKESQLVELRASKCDSVFLMYRPLQQPTKDGVPSIDLELIQANVIIPIPIDWRMKFNKFMEKLVILDHNVEDNGRGDTLYRQSVNRRMRKAMFEGWPDSKIDETLAAIIEVHRLADEQAKEGNSDVN